MPIEPYHIPIPTAGTHTVDVGVGGMWCGTHVSKDNGTVIFTLTDSRGLDVPASQSSYNTSLSTSTGLNIGPWSAGGDKASVVQGVLTLTTSAHNGAEDCYIYLKVEE